MNIIRLSLWSPVLKSNKLSECIFWYQLNRQSRKCVSGHEMGVQISYVSCHQLISSCVVGWIFAMEVDQTRTKQELQEQREKICQLSQNHEKVKCANQAAN